METQSAKVYGTNGLPHFGAKAIDEKYANKVAKVDELFNQFLTGMRAIAVPGNDICLIEFGNWLKTGYYLGTQVAAGKGIVGNA